MLPTVPFFFFNDTATTEIYTLSLHDALPIYPGPSPTCTMLLGQRYVVAVVGQVSDVIDGPLIAPAVAVDIPDRAGRKPRSEEHTTELQSPRSHVRPPLLASATGRICNLAASD